jgi:hypothetical protein
VKAPKNILARIFCDRERWKSKNLIFRVTSFMNSPKKKQARRNLIQNTYLMQNFTSVAIIMLLL